MMGSARIPVHAISANRERRPSSMTFDRPQLQICGPVRGDGFEAARKQREKRLAVRLFDPHARTEQEVHRMRLSAIVHEGSGWPGRVLVPSRPMIELAVTVPVGDGCGVLAGSRDDLLRLGAWIRVAATAPDTVVFLPLSVRRGGGRDIVHLRRSVDLVLGRIGGVPDLPWRPRLGSGRPMTVPVPDAGAVQAPAEPSVDGNRRTLMVTGTEQTLMNLGHLLATAGEAARGLREIRRDGAAHLVSLRGAGRRWEFDVIGVDPAFQRRRWSWAVPTARWTPARPTSDTSRRPDGHAVLARTGRQLGR
jgi:hypothetical protein